MMKLKKMTALMLAAALTGSLLACGASGDSGSSKEDAASGNGTQQSQAGEEGQESGGGGESQESGGDEGNEAEPVEEVTLDIFMGSAGENPITAGIQENAVAQYIKEQTGVTLNVILKNTEKEQAIVASGDLYDMNVVELRYVTPLIQSGAVQSLDDYLYLAPGLSENFSGMLNYSKKYQSNGEDKIYAILERSKGEASPLATSRYGNFIRWEWYKEAGSPSIGSVDDFLNLLKTIQEKHPETEAGKKTYGMSRFNDWGLNFALSDPVIWKYCAQYALNDMCSFGIDDLSYIDLYNDDHMYWQTARMDFKANQMGLLDPETYTQKNEDYTRKIGEGQVFFSSMEWDFDAANAELRAQGGEDQYMDILWEDTEEFPAWVSRASEFGMSARTIVFSSKCDEAKMKGIARLLEFLFSEDGSRSVMIGPKGVTWDYDENGVAVFTEDCRQKMAENQGYLLEQGANSYLGIIGQDYDALAASEANKGDYIDLRLNEDYIKENLTPTEKDYSDFYGVEVPLQAATARQNQSTIYEGYINLMPAEHPTDIQRSMTKISDYLLQNVPVMVFSATQEEFDQKYAEIQAELKNMGYDEVNAYFEEAWEKAKAEYAELMGR